MASKIEIELRKDIDRYINDNLESFADDGEMASDDFIERVFEDFVMAANEEEYAEEGFTTALVLKQKNYFIKKAKITFLELLISSLRDEIDAEYS